MWALIIPMMFKNNHNQTQTLGQPLQSADLYAIGFGVIGVILVSICVLIFCYAISKYLEREN